MKLLCLYIADRHTNMTYANGPEIKYVSFDRLYNERNHGLTNFYQWKEVLESWGCTPEELDAIVYINEYHAFKDGELDGIVPDEFRCIENCCDTYVVDKHMAMMYSAWPIKQTDSAYVFDRFGNDDRCYSVFKDGEIDRDLCTWEYNGGSAYNQLRNIAMQILPDYDEADLYSVASQLVPFGLVDSDHAEMLRGTPYTNADLVWDYSRWKKDWHGDNFDLNYLKTCHSHTVESIVDRVSSDPRSDILVVGSLTQDTMLNYALQTCKKDVTILPHGDETGLSLGGVEWLRRKLNLDYEFDGSAFPFMQQDEGTEEVSDSMLDMARDALLTEAVVGWYQGQGEIGNKTLGHRSILRPAVNNEYLYLMENIKSKQKFQRYRLLVLQEDVDKYFDYGGSAPYGNVTVPVKYDGLENYTRPDGTATIQTIDGDDSLAKLLRKYKEKTGESVLMQTGLCTKGKPLAGKKWQASNILLTTPMDALVVGDTIITK